MESELKIDVADLDAPHRRVLEEVIGCHLQTNQRLIISVTEIDLTPVEPTRPRQSLEDWKKVYEGLSDSEIDEIDEIANTRADFTRNLP